MMKKLVLTAAVMVLTATASVGAQSREGRLSPALALARICVSEAGWNCFDSGDGLAIHEVILRGAARHDMSYSGFARSYSSAAGRERRHLSERMRWIRELSATGAAPPSWPTHRHIRREGRVEVRPSIPWSHYRESWMAVVERAQEVVGRYALDNIRVWGICASPVHDWGGAMDRERANRIGLIEVECGETRNDFYARPALR
jgi:hypothetical protein